MAKETTLPNNIKIVTDYISSVESASIAVLVKTGSRHEEEEINGISHFLEHMAFKGTEARTAQDIAEQFDAIGGSFNAYTSREKTVYHAKVLKEDTETAIDIIADILQNSAFLDLEMDRERQVILEEMAQVMDTPDELIFDSFQEVAFPKQALGRSILGTEKFIKEVTPKLLRKYVQDRYYGNNIIISVAGNVQHESIVELVSKKFTAFKSSGKDHHQAANYVGGETRIVKDLEQVHLLLGFKGLSYKDKDYYTKQVLAVALGGGMSSRLFQEIREKRGLAYGVSAATISYEDTGIFGLYAATNENKASEVLEVMSEQMRDMTYNISIEELKRAKTQLKSSVVMSQESVSARAERLAYNHAVFGRQIPVDEVISKLERISVEDLQNTLKNILSSKDKLTLASIGKLNKLYDYNKVTELFDFS